MPYKDKNKEKEFQRRYRIEHSKELKEYKKHWQNKVYFGGNRQIILKRDDWTCQNCGMTNEQHILLFGITIAVYHIDGKGRNVKIKNNSLSNLITLCFRCHRNKELKNAKRDIKGRFI